MPNENNTMETAMLLVQDRRARRAVEKKAPDLLPQYDALVKNGAGPLMRAIYMGGFDDGMMEGVSRVKLR